MKSRKVAKFLDRLQVVKSWRGPTHVV